MEAPDSPDLTGALEAALEREASAHTGQENESADQQREWETDSSPYDSSSDSSSEDDSEDEEYGDHPLLSMEETARILMAEINADENDGAKSRAAESAIRSKHELLNEVLPKPDVTITSDMEIKSLGNVKFIVDNTIVIQGLAPGHHQVIDLESVLCKEDRTVIGALHEVLGNVTSPLYTVGFNNREAIQELQLAVGTPIFFSVPHAKYVLTQPLRQVKGTDASNLHDEEVPEDEMEFSDDEKEQLFKKQKKLQNQTKRRGGQPLGQRRSSPSAVSIATSATLDYDEDEEGPYRPLARPTGFGSSTLPPRPDHSAYQNRSHSNGGRPGGNSRGR
ncbi:Gar1/Naf1 RNA binding region-domain-containing protein, partial [Cladorrhinum sp. PSN332]